MPRIKNQEAATSDAERDAWAAQKLEYDRCQLVEKVDEAEAQVNSPLHPVHLKRAKTDHREAVEALADFDAQNA